MRWIAALLLCPAVISPVLGAEISFSVSSGTEPVPSAGPWTPVCAHFKQTHPSGPASDLKAFCMEDIRFQSSVLIATVPDPELTHLSLSFDRIVESITRAATDGDLADERYTLDGYWFPWLTNLKEEPDAGKRAKADAARSARSNTPGLLLFRSQKPDRSDKLLLVFLVGETPTSGVNLVALSDAWRYMERLATTRLPICGSSPCNAILGPTFTGSVSSLNYFLTSTRPVVPVIIVSGSATGDLADAFKTVPNTAFCTTTRSNQERFEVVSAFLKSRTGAFNPREFAFLSEDETAYGESSGFPKALNLRYPRGIARLRNSTREVPGDTAKSPQTSTYGNLPMNLTDTGRDSIPAFSEQQTPLSQEAVLSSLAATLRNERIRYLGLIATDPLDELFLSRAVRTLAPNIRIVLFHSDLLFARQSREWGLSGILAVTPYSLVARNQFVASADRPNRTQFADEMAEGTYNAVRRMLLGSTGSISGTASGKACPSIPIPQNYTTAADLMLDYSDPFQSRSSQHEHKPPVWITMLGRDQWWPVAAISGGSASGSLLLGGPLPASHPAGEQFRAEEGLRLWAILYWVFVGVCALHTILIGLMNTSWSHAATWKQRMFQFLPFRHYGIGYREELDRNRRWLLTMACLVVCFGCIVLAIADVSSGVGSGAAASSVACLAAAEMIWLCLPPCYACVIVPLMASAVLLPSRLTWTGIQGGTTSNWLRFSGYRAVHVESGTSMLLPVLALLLAVWLFLRTHLVQSRMAEDWHGTFPSIPALGEGLSPDHPDSPVPDLREPQWLVIGMSLLAWVLFFRPWSALRTIEGLAFDGVTAALSSLLFCCLTVALVRIVALWLQLRKLLQALERHPLRYAFSRLPKEFTWTSVWSGDPRPRLLVPFKAVQLLKLTGDLRAYRIEGLLNRIANPQEPYILTHLRVIEANNWMAEAAQVLARGLEIEWQKGNSDSLVARAIETKSEFPKYAAQEEFLALRFVAWIRYHLLAIRALLKFIGYGFILLVAGLTAYPFEAHRQISLALIMVFLGIACGLVFVFADMNRDPLLSRLSDTDANELSRELFFRLASFGALPLTTLLATQVPEIGNVLLRWVQPALEAIR